MKTEATFSWPSLHQGPAQPGAGRQGVWQERAVGVANATSRPERSQQHSMPGPGAAGRTAFMEYPG